MARHQFPHAGNIVKTLQPEPKAFCPRFAVALSAEKAPKAGNHSQSITKRWRLDWRNRVFFNIGAQSLPLCLFEKNRARYIRGFTSQFRKVVDTPRHHHINGKASFNALSGPWLPLLYLAAAFQGAMIHFNTPAFGVPVKLFHRLVKIKDLTGGQKHPFERFDSCRGFNFTGQHCPDTKSRRFLWRLGGLS